MLSANSFVLSKQNDHNFSTLHLIIIYLEYRILMNIIIWEQYYIYLALINDHLVGLRGLVVVTAVV